MIAMKKDVHILVWGSGNPRAMRVHWALRELRLDYALQEGAPADTLDEMAYKTAMPTPPCECALKDGSILVNGSAAIVAYLSRRYRNVGNMAYPKADEQRTRWLEWTFFAVSELDSTTLHLIRRHKELTHRYGAAPKVIQGATEYFQKQLGYLECSLEDERPFVLGETFTSADILIASCLIWASSYGIEMPDTVAEYMQRLTSRPAYQAAIASQRELTA